MADCANSFSPLTVVQLRDLRSAEARSQRERLVGQYIDAIRRHVIGVATHGSFESTWFWVVSPTVARVHLRHVEGEFYSWHSKFVVKTGYPLQDALLKRPIPEELIVPIGERLGALFPDADIKLTTNNIILGCELQQFLVIRWSVVA
jgi:hypothetical protein